MTEVSAWTHPVSVVARELTYEEVADLDRLRAVLASAVDRTEARAISWLWDSMVTAHGGRPAPAGFVEAVATAIGDLLAVHVPGVRWSVWPGPGGPTLGVASDARPHSPVVPFLDAQDRWDSRDKDWVVDYLARAAAHLAGSSVPQPRHAPDDAAVPTAAPGAPVAQVPFAVPATGYGSVPAEESQSAADARDAEAATAVEVTPAAQPAAVVGPAPVVEPVAPPVVTAEPAFVAPPAPATPPAPVFVPDMPLQDFALDALDHAMSLLRETGAFDGEVFVLLLDGAGRRTESCPGDPGDARLRARELVRSSGAARAAITWVERNPVDLPGPRQTFPAVVVDAWDVGWEGLRVARRFVDDVLGTGPLGGRLVVGPVGPLL